MVDQAASRPQGGSAGATAPSMRVDLREETVTEKATPGKPHISGHVAFTQCLLHLLVLCSLKDCTAFLQEALLVEVPLTWKVSSTKQQLYLRQQHQIVSPRVSHSTVF